MSKYRDTIISHDFDVSTRRLLVKQGAPHLGFLRKGTKLVLDDAVCEINAEIPRVANRFISESLQLTKIKKIFKKPLFGNYVLTISSFPSDTLARNVGIYLMGLALESYYQKREQAGSNKIKRASLPLWHRIYGGWDDKLLKHKENPCMLFISNVTDTSTVTRKERVRDLLETYEDIPRIIITSPTNPLTFASDFRYLTNASLYLSPPDVNRLEI